MIGNFKKIIITSIIIITVVIGITIVTVTITVFAAIITIIAKETHRQQDHHHIRHRSHQTRRHRHHHDHCDHNHRSHPNRHNRQRDHNPLHHHRLVAIPPLPRFSMLDQCTAQLMSPPDVRQRPAINIESWGRGGSGNDYSITNVDSSREGGRQRQ